MAGQLTPMMQQYMETKKQYPDCILFYRLGDFYEMFFEDAKVASRELELTLTGKSCGLDERAPMCGVPHHAVDSYLTRLVKKGYKVCIVEQTEDPASAKGLVKREVTRIVTPGTNLNTESMDATKNNYLMCITAVDEVYGISTVDITTGDYYVTEVDSLRLVQDELYKFMPAELICNHSMCMTGLDFEDCKNRLGISVYPMDDWYFDDKSCMEALKSHFHVMSLDGLGLADYSCGMIAAGALLLYLTETQKSALEQLTRIVPYSTGKYMVLDTSTRRNLELLETLREKQKRGSLLWVLDKTKTAMGARMLRSFIEQPLLSAAEIRKRQDAIAAFNRELITRDEVREYLDAIYDLERLISKIAYRSANPRDFISFKNSIAMIEPIRTLLQDIDSSLVQELKAEMHDLSELANLIETAIEEEPPISVKEGGIIREGYDEEVDRLRSAKIDGKNWLAEMEQKEREATGIKNLRIKYNRVFGYYLEVTNSFKEQVPARYIRKQTLTNAERFTTPELKELEDTILGAEDKLYTLEYRLFEEIRSKIASYIIEIQDTAKAIAKLDVYASLAYVAERNDFVRPTINEKGRIQIEGGRHPVVELMMDHGMFVSNDTMLDKQKNRAAIITGPNMAGKSTYMRQVALIALMAQIGSFVPAKKADIGICDRIFTRVGASDDLASGQSTFMVEMTEVANILRNATSNSLLILDEIGRGTSTFDGLSIAWAVVEHIVGSKGLGAKTLFATHYHELTQLEGKLAGVNNYCIAVKEQGDSIVFLRKIMRGGADKSYGIQVAKLAGVPDDVIHRAKELVEELSNSDILERAKNIHISGDSNSSDRSKLYLKEKKKEKKEFDQISLFENELFAPEMPVVEQSKVEAEILRLDLSRMTPIDALNKLYQLQKKCK